MASQVGMTIRTSKANERIDTALKAMAKGTKAPARPDRVRDPLLDSVLRLEWIADTLEAVATQPEPKPSATTRKAA
jgi:hypothetical protein